VTFPNYETEPRVLPADTKLGIPILCWVLVDDPGSLCCEAPVLASMPRTSHCTGRRWNPCGCCSLSPRRLLPAAGARPVPRLRRIPACGGLGADAADPAGTDREPADPARATPGRGRQLASGGICQKGGFKFVRGTLISMSLRAGSPARYPQPPWSRTRRLMQVPQLVCGEASLYGDRRRKRIF
jgi:hypothetical protein